MSTRSHPYAVPTAVYLGAVVLVGVPVFAASVTLFGEVLAWMDVVETLGLSGTGESAVFLLFVLLALAIALQLATEAAALQLGGLNALSRGSQQAMILRHVLLFVGVVVALSAITWVALSAVFQTDGLVLATPGIVLALATILVLARASNALLDGYRTVE